MSRSEKPEEDIVIIHIRIPMKQLTHSDPFQTRNWIELNCPKYMITLNLSHVIRSPSKCVSVMCWSLLLLTLFAGVERERLTIYRRIKCNCMFMC